MKRWAARHQRAPSCSAQADAQHAVLRQLRRNNGRNACPHIGLCRCMLQARHCCRCTRPDQQTRAQQGLCRAEQGVLSKADSIAVPVQREDGG